MIIKKFVPCIYLYHEHAVRNLTDTTIVDTDPVRLADYYCEHNADELIVFDMSEGDAEHDAALDIIKEICTRAEVDVIGAGNVKRMEDIKKLLYAGCKKAVLDYEKESNIEITEEVSLKFGKDKILISYNDPSVLELHKEKIEKYISAMILMNPHQIRETQAILSLPFFVQINQVALNKLLEIFAYENVCGVTGNTINDNVKEIVALKDLCRENDIPMESSWSPLYNSAYIEGIGNLYEFDCGELSGWMYSVNGEFPNYGCSGYTLQDGDVICWVYTCDLGEDVGGGYAAGGE